MALDLGVAAAEGSEHGEGEQLAGLHVDAVHDTPNMPLADEPQRVREDLQQLAAR